MITVILNGFRRPHTLKQQYDAIKNQTVGDTKIILWANSIQDSIDQYPPEVVSQCESVMSNSNFGVWGRFSIALNASTEYVTVIDDDTIPGPKWFENCLNTMNTHEGVLTTRGITANLGHDHMYPNPESYEYFGWCKPNEEVKRVDVGCHSWFFKKEWLRAFWAEMPRTIPMRCGEDMHISYAVKKHFGLNTYVPPHPADDMDMWGSDPESAQLYGVDGRGCSQSSEALMGMNAYWNFLRRQCGYGIIAEESNA